MTGLAVTGTDTFARGLAVHRLLICVVFCLFGVTHGDRKIVIASVEKLYSMAR